MGDDFNVTVGEFSGPLDLVLKLVQERKMLVNDITLADIADDFIEYVSTQPSLPLAETADFLVVATTLLLIKSRSLIPEFSLTKEEEGDVADLEARLAAYRAVREVAKALALLQSGDRIILGAPRPRQVRFVAPKELRPLVTNVDGASQPYLGQADEQSNGEPRSGVAILRANILRLIENLPTMTKLPEAAIEKMASLGDVMEETLARLQSALAIRFSARRTGGGATTLDKNERKRVIVGFLALLELARRGLVALKQAEHFNDIEVETGGFGVPVYN